MTDQLFHTETPTAATRPVGKTTGRADGTGEGPNARPLVVGIDLSLTRTGVATATGVTCITSSGKRGDTLSQRQQRLRHLRRRIIAAVEHDGEPALIVIEGPSYSSNTAGSHDRSGLWWLLIDVFTIRGWHVIEAAPATRMKYATGKGRADKDAVLAAAIKRLPIEVANNDEADAAVLCAIGHDLLGDPLALMPEGHRAALDVLRAQLTPGDTA